MVVFDATMLLLAVNPDAGKPTDPATGKAVENVGQRIAFLLSQVDKTKAKIGLPTPALSEAMVRSTLHPAQIVNALQSLSVFQILPFDDRAAIELALIQRSALETGDKKDGSQETWAKVKFDRQIAAIAKVAQADRIYTDDQGLRNACKKQNIEVVGLADMVIPTSAAQIEMFVPATEIAVADLDADENEDEPKDV